MFSSERIRDSEIAEALRHGLEGVEPSPRVWTRIEASIDPEFRSTVGLLWTIGRSIPVQLAGVAVLFAVAYGIWNWTQESEGEPETVRTATFGSETRPLIEVGDNLVTVGEVPVDGLAPNRAAPLADQSDPAAMSSGERLLELPLEFHTVDTQVFDRALANLAFSAFTVRSVQAGRNYEETHIFNQRMDSYWNGVNLNYLQLVREDDCVTSPIDIPEVGSKTICQLYARADGVNVGESYSMPVYRVTEATYSPTGEATMRVDDRSSSVFSINRSTVYQGIVDLWRVSDGEVEHRVAISTGNFDLVSGAPWRPADVELETGSPAEIIEWLLAMQMPDADFAGNNVFDERFAPGSTFEQSSFFDLQVIPSADDSVVIFEARREPGFYGHRYGVDRWTFGRGEMLRFEIDAETERLERLLVTADSNIPYALQFSFALPIVFEFEYDD